MHVYDIAWEYAGARHFRFFPAWYPKNIAAENICVPQNMAVEDLRVFPEYSI